MRAASRVRRGPGTGGGVEGWRGPRRSSGAGGCWIRRNGALERVEGLFGIAREGVTAGHVVEVERPVGAEGDGLLDARFGVSRDAAVGLAQAQAQPGQESTKPTKRLSVSLSGRPMAAITLNVNGEDLPKPSTGASVHSCRITRGTRMGPSP